MMDRRNDLRGRRRKVAGRVAMISENAVTACICLAVMIFPVLCLFNTLFLP